MKKILLTLIAICCWQFTQAQQNQPVYENLVFEGGGIRGIAYGGVLFEMDSLEMLDDLKRVGGTSVGAIQATLLAVGYTPQEMIDVIASAKFQKFSDGRGMFFGGTRRTLRYYGWYRGDRFEQWIGDLIEAKTGNADLTFAELHAQHQKSPNKHLDLYITATNLTLQRMEGLSHENFPNMPIKDAVRISMSVPLYFRAVFLNEEGTIVRKPKKNDTNLWVMVDGGIIANYPIHIFDEQQYLPNATPGDTAFVVNPHTLGIRLEREDQIEYDEQRQGLAPYPINGFTDYIGAFYNLVIEHLNRHTLTEDDWKRTVMVGTAGIGPKIKKLSLAQKQLLIDSGRQGVQHYFALN